MSKKSFMALCAAAAIALILAVTSVLTQPQFEASDKQGALAFPNLVKDADRLKTIVIRHGNETVSLDWDGKLWHARERSNYLADSEKVNQLIVTLARMVKIEGKTKQPDRYSRLEVEDPTGKNAQGRQITLLDNAGKELANVIVGKRQYNMGTQTSNTYIRLGGDPQVWLATGEFTPETAMSYWLQGTIADINPAIVKSVTVTHPNGDKVVVGRGSPGAADMVVENLPKGATPPPPNTTAEYATVLSGMSLEEVAPAADKPFPKDKITTAVIEGQTGFQVTVEIADIDGQDWIKLKGIPPAANSNGTPKPGDSGVVDLRTDWNKVINDLNARTDGWVFQVPEFQISPLKKHMADLLKKQSTPAMPGMMPVMPASGG